MSQASILIVEDDAPLRLLLRYTLEASHFQVEEAPDSRKALELLAKRSPSLILLDWVLPGLSGLEFARHLKQTRAYRQIALIMLTSKAEEDNKVLGLEAGADDYITKPFLQRELIARIHAVLRRGPIKDNSAILQVGRLVMDQNSQQVSIDGQLLKLGPLEFRLLRFLLKHQDRVYTRDELLNYVWSADTYVDERTVDVHILRLRKNLALYGCDGFIQTVHGSGYRLSNKATQASESV